MAAAVARGLPPLRPHPNPTNPSADLSSREILSTIPVDTLFAELQRRQDGRQKPACGTEGVLENYNMGAHVFALFLILALSTLGKTAMYPASGLQH